MTQLARMLVLIPCVLVLRLPVSAAEPLDPNAVESILRRTRDAWHVPGLTAAIVRGGDTLYLGGVGIRRKGKDEPVSADTLFPIGSLTKAFTATTLAQLVDDGKAGWDDRVRQHLSWFRMNDPLADREVTFRDLLCHRTGLSRHELLWKDAPWSLEETVRRLAFVPPTHPFRSTYEYNNLAYITVGLAVESIAGRPWHQHLRRRLLEPLQIHDAVFTRSEIEKTPNHASPHHRDAAGKVEAIPFYNDDRQIRASGSLKMSVRDLRHWLLLQLDGGRYDGRRLVSARNFEQTHTPHTPVPLDADLVRLTEATQDSYGLGWHLTDYRGHVLHEHGGAVPGFRAHIFVLPRDGLGVVVLANVDDSGVVLAAGYSLLDHLLHLKEKDWPGYYRKQTDKQTEKTRDRHRKLLASRRPGTHPSRELDNYAGTYFEPAYGTAQVRLEGEHLELCWSSFRVKLEHYHFDTFLPQVKEEHPLRDERVRFELDDDGNVAVLHMLGRALVRRRR